MFQQPYAKYYNLFNQTKPYKREVEFVYNLAGRPSSILDIGCGNAEYWRFYPKEVEICGVDKSFPMIKMADKNRRIIHSDIEKFKTNKVYECATALFDVLNYIPRHDWWSRLPIVSGGSFVFDIWDKQKVDKDGFKETVRDVEGIVRRIIPIKYDGHRVDLKIQVWEFEDFPYIEMHRMYLYSHKDIERFCGKSFEISEVKTTKTWQTFYKCVKK